MPATFLFPDTLIADPSPLRHPAVQAGQRLLRRARLLSRFEDDSALPAETLYEQWLRRELRVPDQASLEAASVYADEVDAGLWRLTPVHLHLASDHILLTDPSALALDLDDARRLAAAIAPTLADAGMSLTVADAGRWYLRSAEDLELRCFGWRVASGRSIDGFQPTGASARRWRQILTEIQMAWHEHPLNEARAQRGLPAVNSLWIDGLAAGPKRFDYDICCTDLPALRGLARYTAAQEQRTLRVLPLARLAEALADRGKRVLVALDPTSIGDDAASAAGRAPDGQADAGVPGDPADRLQRHWQRAVAALSPPRALPALADAFGASPSVRIVLTGDRRMVELAIGARDQWAFTRQSQLASWFEPGERGLLRGAA